MATTKQDKAENESTNPNAESEDNTQVADAGVPGQILYPDREVDAEHAAAFAAGKEDNLYADEDDPRNATWENPADRPAPDEDESVEDDDGE